MQRLIFSIGLLFFFFLCTSAICFKKEIPVMKNATTIKKSIQNDTLISPPKVTQQYQESNARYAYNTALMAVALFLTYAISVSAIMLKQPKLLPYILLCSIVLLASSIIDFFLHFSNKKKYPKFLLLDALTRVLIAAAGFFIWNKYR